MDSIINAIEKFCAEWKWIGLKDGNSLASALARALVKAIEDDLISTDFTPEQINQLRPAVHYEGFLMSPVLDLISDAVIKFDMFKHQAHRVVLVDVNDDIVEDLEWADRTDLHFKLIELNEADWQRSMNGTRNLGSELFEDRFERFASEIKEAARDNLIALVSIQEIWNTVKKLPRTYQCICTYKISGDGKRISRSF